MDTKIRHLYEVAVITAFTAAPAQAPAESGKESGSTVSCQQDPPQQVAYQLPQDQYWTPAAAPGNFPTSQDYRSWELSAQANAANFASGQSWCVENAPSVSDFTSSESISSWGPDAWSRESLRSQESFGNPSYSQNYVNCASGQPYTDSGFMDPESAFDAMTFYDSPIDPNDAWQSDDVTFIPGPIHSDEFWRTDNGACAFPHSEVTGEDEGTQQNHFEDMLERVAQDLTYLEVNAAHHSSWQTATPVCEIYGDTTGSSQTFLNSFEDTYSAHGQFYSYPQNFNLGQVHGVRDLASALQFEGDRQSDSVADSGQVSRASSLTSLAATSSDVSEDNMADMESCESISEQRGKLLKRKLSSSTRDMNINLLNSSHLTLARSQSRNPASTNTKSQNIKLPAGGCRSTSSCSESMASYSLTSDSETDLKSQINNMSLADWTRMKREKLQSTLSAQHPKEASSSTSAWRPEVPSSSTKSCSESVSAHSLSSDSEKGLKSNINNMSFADWTRMKREKLQSASSAMHPTEAISSTPAWKPELCQNSQMSDSSFASRPHVYQNPHNELSYWDSGIDHTGNLTHFLDTSNNIFYNTPNVSTYTYYNESTHPTENPQYVSPNCNSFSTCYTNDTARLPEQEPPPYICSLDHGSEFIAIQDLAVNMLPPGYQSWENLNTILEISHRVVKLRVHKQFNFTQHEDNSSEAKPADTGEDASEEPILEHYGTGFACHVDKETVVIRTHSHLVGSSIEASSTEVTFVMTFPNVIGNHQITCTGVAEGFSSNDYSQSARFVCKTPPDLLSFLHFFKDVPVVRKNSLFNDSSYFTDSSPDTSTSLPDELENDHKNTTVQKDKENILQMPSDSGVSNQADARGRPLSGHSNPSSLYSHVLANRNGESLKPTTQKSDCCEEHSLTNVVAENYSHTRSQQVHSGLCMNMSTDYEHRHVDSVMATTNAFTSATKELHLLDDTTVISSKSNVPPDQAFQSRKYHHTHHSLNSKTPEILWQNSMHVRSDSSSTAKFLGIQQETTLLSPMVIMEKRFDALNAASATQYCPYADLDIFGRLGAYTNFSSFAGDVFSHLALDFTSKSSLKTGDSADTGKWEYEKLLFLQNNHRDSYNKQHPPAKRGHSRSVRSAALQDTSEDGSMLSTEKSIVTQDFENKTSFDSKSLVKLQTPAAEHTQKDIHQSDQPYNVKTESFRLMDGSSCTSGSTSGSDRRNVFAEFSSDSDYLDTWDRDLLNLDIDLSPIPDDDFFETMVNNLLQDSDQDATRLDTHPVCCPQGDLSSKSSYSDPICIVISHPHGGPKMISIGFFSGHRHIGGILYDTPTCMGSCGAPVIALTESATSPYLTNFVHSGTVKVNGVPVGTGVAYFDL